jgi:hypothetical protein
MANSGVLPDRPRPVNDTWIVAGCLVYPGAHALSPNDRHGEDFRLYSAPTSSSRRLGSLVGQGHGHRDLVRSHSTY